MNRLYLVPLLIFLGCSLSPEHTSTTTINSLNTISPPLSPTQQAVIDLHNEKRHYYFENADLHYSLELEAAAQAYANRLAKEGSFRHDPDNQKLGYGENLYAHTQKSPITIQEAMKIWYDQEMPYYNYDDGSCKEGYDNRGRRVHCGHYTQVIWRDTKEVGCANAQYKNGVFKGGYVYVCKYKKAGNVILNGHHLRPY